MTTYQRVEMVRRTMRYEFPGRVDAKTIGLAVAWISQEYEKVHGHLPIADDAYWIEAMDNGIAFAFDSTTMSEVRRDSP